MNTRQQITSEIIAHMQECGGRARDWYVGIAANARDRLFGDHAVKENGDSWIFREAANHTDARAIEEHFHKNVGARGGPGGGDAATRFVYAYWIAAHTVE